MKNANQMMVMGMVSSVMVAAVAIVSVIQLCVMAVRFTERS